MMTPRPPKPVVAPGNRAVGHRDSNGVFQWLELEWAQGVACQTIARIFRRNNERFYAAHEVCPNPHGRAGQNPAKRMRAGVYAAKGYLNVVYEPIWQASGLSMSGRPGAWEGPWIEFACVLGDARAWSPSAERLTGIGANPPGIGVVWPPPKPVPPTDRWGARIATDCPVCQGHDLGGWAAIERSQPTEWWAQWHWDAHWTDQGGSWWHWTEDEHGALVATAGPSPWSGSELLTAIVCAGCDRSNQDHHPAIRGARPKALDPIVPPTAAVKLPKGTFLGGLEKKVAPAKEKRRKGAA